MKKKIFIIIGIVVLGLGGVYGMTLANNSSNEVLGMVVEEMAYEEIISAIGYVDYETEVIIKSEVGGVIQNIEKDVSDYVEINDELLYIDDSAGQLTYEDLENTLALSEARLSDYIITYNNTYTSTLNQDKVYDQEIVATKLSISQLDEEISKMTVLVETGINAESDLESLLNQQAILNESLESIYVKQDAVVLPPYAVNELETAILIAKTNLEQQTIELEKYKVTASLKGLIIDRYVEEGELIQSGQELFKIASDNQKYVVVDIDEKYFNSLKIGDEVNLMMPQDLSNEMKGTIAEFSPQIDIETGTIEVKVEILEQKEAFIQNMSVRVDFSAVSFDEAIVIPDEYLVSNDGTSVYMINNENVVVEKEISVYNQNLPNVYVIEGLEKGDVILMPEDLKVGEEVEVVVKGEDGL
jgi:multidrug efflux pump subunit AcrA (membrane-fusion protein)